MVPRRNERVGVFGGTFDPIHNGHLVAATTVRHACRLDRLLVMPAGDPWQKSASVVASATDRAALVEAAIAGIDGLDIDRRELDRVGSTYTIDTLRALAQPDRELLLVLGADSVANLATWREPQAVLDLATIVAVRRAGDEPALPDGLRGTLQTVTMPRLDLASRDIRARVARGAPIDGLVPPAVVREIRARGLYTAAQ